MHIELSPIILYPLGAFLALKTLILFISLLLELKAVLDRGKDRQTLEELINLYNVEAAKQAVKKPVGWVVNGGERSN